MRNDVAFESNRSRTSVVGLLDSLLVLHCSQSLIQVGNGSAFGMRVKEQKERRKRTFMMTTWPVLSGAVKVGDCVECVARASVIVDEGVLRLVLVHRATPCVGIHHQRTIPIQ